MTAVLIISLQGTITGANSVARDYLRMSGEADPAGRFFPELFELDVVAETEEDKIFQWELLRDSAESGPLSLLLRPETEEEEDATENLPVTVNLERCSPPGAEAFFIASISPQESEKPPEAAAPRPTTVDANPWSELERATHLGFFSLEFPDGPFYFSPVWKRMLGYEPHELPDRHETLIKLTHPEDSEATPDHPPSGKPESRLPFSVEFRMRHKSGHYVWVQSVGIHSYGPSGALERAIGFHLDVQERKELEEESLHNEERFLTLVERGRFGFFDLDLRNRRAWFSSSWQRMLGYHEGDLENMPDTFRRLMDQKATPDDLLAVFTAPDGDSRFVRELRMQKKDGSFINLQTHIVRLTNRRGDLTRVVGFQVPDLGTPTPVWDQPTRPEALHAALDAVNEAVVLTDAHASVTFFNAKARALTGASGDVGAPLSESVSLIHAHDLSPAENLADQVLATGHSILFTREFLLEQNDDEPREIVLSCLPLRDAREKILGAVLIFRDPVEMSLSPEELAKSNRMESLGLLAGGVAHDFNNLLTSIVGGISLARETRNWELLDNSEKAGLSAKNLTRQLLTFARGRPNERKPQHLGNLIRDCLRLSSAGSNISAKLDLPEELHPAAVDSAKMSQVFQNLIINAIQGMGDNGGALTISGENVALADGDVAGLDSGDYIRIAVKDSGKGIPPENLARIFDPFFTTKKTGTGLGLSTVAAIVRDHEGQITVKSIVGTGTTFSVYLPVAKERVEAESRRLPTLKFGTGRILFMDDDEEIAALAAGMLHRLDYEYDIARNGEEAIALYRRYLKVDRPYDAVILDLTIVGGMGGEETLAKLRELDPDVRAIVSSGYSTDDSRDYYLNKGFYGVLSKPYRSEEMGKVLRHVLGKDSEQPDTKIR